MLKMNSHTILNALDFKKHFAAWDAMGQLGEIADFAKIHCLKLAILLEAGEVPGESNAKPNRSNLYSAKFLNKAFWLNIVEQGSKPAADWKYLGDSTAACMRAILNEAFPVEEPDARDPKIQQEYEDAAVEKKLQHIVENGKLTSSQEDIRNAVILLALCELAEVDVFQQDFRRWDKTPDEAADPVPANQKKERSNEKKQSQAEQATEPVEKLPNAPVLRVNARKEPYRFYWYEHDYLNPSDTIRSVRIKASAGQKKEHKVTIQLVHPITNQIVQTIIICAGNYRDCTAVNGRIIKFLPTMAISQNLCVARNPDSDCFEVVPYGSKPWTIDMSRSQVNEITCVAVGDSRDQGFLFVADGEVISSFYKPAEDYAVRMDLLLIFDTIVEARIEPDGYCLLTSTGTVISDIPSWNCKKHLVSLYDRERNENIRIENLKDVAEIAMSIQEKSLAIRDANGNLDIIFENDQFRSFQCSADGLIQINTMGGSKNE